VKPADPAKLAGLMRIARMREVAARADLAQIGGEEAAILRQIAELDDHGAGAAAVDAAVLERWRLWKARQSRIHLRDLALVRARKDSAQAAVALASAKTEALSEICRKADEHRRRDRATRLEARLLADALLARDKSRDQSS
jgi:hypothetical protein